MGDADEAIRQRLGIGDAIALRLAHLPVRPPMRLTPGERQVINLMAQGRSDAQIARARGTSVRTVLNQLASVLRKLGIGSRDELMSLLKAPAK